MRQTFHPFFIFLVEIRTTTKNKPSFFMPRADSYMKQGELNYQSIQIIFPKTKTEYSNHILPYTQCCDLRFRLRVHPIHPSGHSLLHPNW